MGHDLTFRIRDWECVTQLEDRTPVSVELTLHLASLEVLRGDGGMKPLTEGDKKKVLAGASKTLGNGPSRFTASKVTGRYMLHGLLDLHGVQRAQVVRVAVAEVGDAVRITGSARVRQSQHGIVPYTQMMGALHVADDVDVLVEVVVPASAVQA